MGERETWQPEMWAYFDTTPEFKQAVIYTGSVASKVRVFGAAMPDGDEDGDPIPVTAEESGISADLALAVTEELAKLRSPLGGQPEILRLINMNLEVAGECFLVGWAAREEKLDPFTQLVVQEAVAERWVVHSISEVTVTGQGQTRIKEDGKGRGIPLEPELGDAIIRIWVRHPQWTSRPDTAWRGCLMELRTLQALANERLAVSQGNMTRGVFKLSNNVHLAGQPPGPSGDGQENPVLAALSAAVLDPVADPDDVHALDYVYIQGDKDDLSADVFGPIDMSRKRDAELKGEVEASVLRMARAANLPVEKILGHMSTTFANARQINQDEFDDYHDPRMRAIVDAITVGYLIPNLEAREQQFDAGQLARVVAWFDPTDLIGEPATEDSADKGAELLYISGAAWRNAKGFTDDDAPDPIEILTTAGLRRGLISPELNLAFLQQLADDAGVEMPTFAQALLPKTAPLETPGSVTEQAQGALPSVAAAASQQEALLLTAMLLQQRIAAARANGRPPEPLALARAPQPVSGRLTGVRPGIGAQLVRIDARLHAQLQVAASAAMERALERAGNKLRNKLSATNKALVAGVAPRLVAARLGPSLVADAADDDDLLDGAWDDLAVSYLGLTIAAQRQARDQAARVVTVDFDRLEEIQDADAAASWDWTAAELRSLALQRLYNPDPTVALGESNPSLSVPAGLLRSAMARAGGAITDAGNGPVGGVATGASMMGALSDGGATVGKWTWTYGGSPNPFPPHEDLDGLDFDSYDDPELANSEPFPPFGFFFPGDHDGCECWIEPTVEGPAPAPASE